MRQTAIPRPEPDEYAPFYAGYVATVAAGDVGAILDRQGGSFRSMCAGLSDDRARFRYAPGKWSIKEVIGHVCDAERIFAYRALRIMRSDATPLPGFAENPYVEAAGFDRRSIEDLLREFDVIRSATLSLLSSVEPEWWERRGVASGAEVSLRALVHIIAGHCQHHLQILVERYGVESPPTEPSGSA